MHVQLSDVQPYITLQEMDDEEIPYPVVLDFISFVGFLALIDGSAICTRRSWGKWMIEATGMRGNLEKSMSVIEGVEWETLGLRYGD